MEASQRSLAEGATSAVSSLTSQARSEFQAQGSSVGETRAAMEAPYASCCRGLQPIRDSQQQSSD
eukprot:1952172-Alexandrium_andersonii.AAC.1